MLPFLISTICSSPTKLRVRCEKEGGNGLMKLHPPLLLSSLGAFLVCLNVLGLLSDLGVSMGYAQMLAQSFPSSSSNFDGVPSEPLLDLQNLAV